MSSSITKENNIVHDFLSSFIKFLVNSNIFIALCALAAVYQTYTLLGLPVTVEPLSAFVFCATLFLYNILRMIRLPDADMKFQMHTWMKKHLNLMYFIVGVSFSGMAVCFFYLDRQAQLALVLMGLTSLFYVVPFVKIKSFKLRLRDFGIVKPFIVGVVWAVSTVVIPYLHFNIDITRPVNYLMILERFLFIAALTIPFDIKDMEDDQRLAFKTISVKWGVKTTLVVSTVTLILFLAAALAPHIFWPVNSEWKIAGTYVLSFIIALYLIWKTGQNSEEYHYTFLLDSVILLQFILIYINYTI